MTRIILLFCCLSAAACHHPGALFRPREPAAIFQGQAPEKRASSTMAFLGISGEYARQVAAAERTRRGRSYTASLTGGRRAAEPRAKPSDAAQRPLHRVSMPDPLRNVPPPAAYDPDPNADPNADPDPTPIAQPPEPAPQPPPDAQPASPEIPAEDG